MSSYENTANVCGAGSGGGYCYTRSGVVQASAWGNMRTVANAAVVAMAHSAVSSLTDAVRRKHRCFARGQLRWVAGLYFQVHAHPKVHAAYCHRSACVPLNSTAASSPQVHAGLRPRQQELCVGLWQQLPAQPPPPCRLLQPRHHGALRPRAALHRRAQPQRVVRRAGGRARRQRRLHRLPQRLPAQ